MLQENSRTEFKSELNDKLEKEVVAFLNNKEGGILYIGLDDIGSPIGVPELDSTQLKIADRIKNNGSYEFVPGNWFIIKMNEYDEVRAVYNIVYNKEIIRKEYAAYLRSDDKTGEFKIYAPTKTEKGEEVDSCGYESMEVQESKGVQERK